MKFCIIVNSTNCRNNKNLLLKTILNGLICLNKIRPEIDIKIVASIFF